MTDFHCWIKVRSVHLGYIETNLAWMYISTELQLRAYYSSAILQSNRLSCLICSSYSPVNLGQPYIYSLAELGCFKSVPYSSGNRRHSSNIPLTPEFFCNSDDTYIVHTLIRKRYYFLEAVFRDNQNKYPFDQTLVKHRVVEYYRNASVNNSILRCCRE